MKERNNNISRYTIFNIYSFVEDKHYTAFKRIQKDKIRR
jgi:hypothetical protein